MPWELGKNYEVFVMGRGLILNTHRFVYPDSLILCSSFKAANCDESRICLAKDDSTTELLPELLSTYIMLLDDELHGKHLNGKGNCYVLLSNKMLSNNMRDFESSNIFF